MSCQLSIFIGKKCTTDPIDNRTFSLYNKCTKRGKIMKTLEQLNAEREKYLHYINVEHYVNMEELCTQEGKGLVQAKINYDTKISNAHDEFERDLLDIHNLYPDAQDKKRIIKEKMATHRHRFITCKAKEHYDLERTLVHRHAVKLRGFEFAQLKLAKEYLEEVNSQIQQIKTSQQTTKKESATM